MRPLSNWTCMTTVRHIMRSDRPRSLFPFSLAIPHPEELLGDCFTLVARVTSSVAPIKQHASFLCCIRSSSSSRLCPRVTPRSRSDTISSTSVSLRWLPFILTWHNALKFWSRFKLSILSALCTYNLKQAQLLFIHACFHVRTSLPTFDISPSAMPVCPSSSCTLSAGVSSRSSLCKEELVLRGIVSRPCNSMAISKENESNTESMQTEG